MSLSEWYTYEECKVMDERLNRPITSPLHRSHFYPYQYGLEKRQRSIYTVASTPMTPVS